MMHGRFSRKNSIPGTGPTNVRVPTTTLYTAWRGAPAAVFAALHLAAAGWLGAELFANGMNFRLHGSCALFFACIGAWFVRAAYRASSRAESGPSGLPPTQRRYWRWCGMCFAGCYAITLSIGTPAWAAYMFWTLFAACHVMVWEVLSGAHGSGSAVNRLMARRPLRAAAWTAYVLLMLPLGCELGLRIYAFAADDRVTVRYVTDLLKFPAGGERLGRTVNSQGYWDDEFQAASVPSALRVAALGDDAVLCGDAQTNFLAQVERLLPGVEVLNFGVPQASPREYAAQLETAVAPCRPDLVLLFFSVATDVTEAPPLPGPFEWRSLHLVQRSLGFVKGTEYADDDQIACVTDGSPAGGASSIDQAARSLQVCRVPVPEAVQVCWRAAFDHLDRIVHRCREAGVEPTLVLVPCEFQVDDRLCRTLCRRAGYRRADQIDIDLPQRRLAAYAKDRRIDMLDLMPHMRASNAPSYLRDAAQFNDHGNALTATILSEWLETQFSGTLLADGS